MTSAQSVFSHEKRGNECDCPVSCRASWVTMVWSGWEMETSVTQKRASSLQAQVVGFRLAASPSSFNRCRGLLSPSYRFCFPCRTVCWQGLPNELRPCPAEDQGAERPRRWGRVFRASNWNWSQAGEERSHSAETLQERHCHVPRSLPLLPGAQHPG